ncbi:MAG: hypothetical protein AAGC55_20055, partial [Myxococcota bacterium]
LDRDPRHQGGLPAGRRPVGALAHASPSTSAADGRFHALLRAEETVRSERWNDASWKRLRTLDGRVERLDGGDAPGSAP